MRGVKTFPRCVLKDITRRRPKSKPRQSVPPEIQCTKCLEFIGELIALAVFLVAVKYLPVLRELFQSK